MAGIGKFPAAAGLLAVGLSACSFNVSDLNPFGKKSVVPQCPRVSVLEGAERITKFKAGPGRDITDIEFEAEILSFFGECEFERGSDGITGVSVTFKVALEATRGPANLNRRSTLEYFVRIPQFYPLPRGSSVFAVRVDFPGNKESVGVVDRDVVLSIPLEEGVASWPPDGLASPPLISIFIWASS